jgi:hypothetical protein
MGALEEGDLRFGGGEDGIHLLAVDADGGDPYMYA